MGSRNLAVAGVLVAVTCGVVMADLLRKPGAGQQGARREAAVVVLAGGASGAAGSPPPRSPAPAQGMQTDAATGADAGALAGEASSQGGIEDGAGKAALLRDPAWRKARLAQLRSMMNAAYPGLADELMLTAGESTFIFDVLAQTRLAVEVEAVLAGLPSADPAQLAESARQRRLMQREQGETMRALLGEERYSQWQEYLQTRPVRQQASEHAAALERAGVPLDAGQLRTFTKVMIAEQQSLKQDILTLGSAVDLAHPDTLLKAQQALQRRRAESSRNVVDAAAPYLSAMQADVLRRQMEQRDPMERVAGMP